LGRPKAPVVVGTVKCQAVEASTGAVWEHSPERVVADRTTIAVGESATAAASLRVPLLTRRAS